jgi:hypothetical protein
VGRGVIIPLKRGTARRLGLRPWDSRYVRDWMAQRWAIGAYQPPYSGVSLSNRLPRADGVVFIGERRLG